MLPCRFSIRTTALRASAEAADVQAAQPVEPAFAPAAASTSPASSVPARQLSLTTKPWTGDFDAMLRSAKRIDGASKEAPSLRAANQQIFADANWPRLWAVLLVMLLFMHCVITELSRVIGRRKLQAMFFGPYTRGRNEPLLLNLHLR